MGLTPGLNSAVDLFRKLKRDVARLDHELTDDHFFNLVITGYSPKKSSSATAVLRMEADPGGFLLIFGAPAPTFGNDQHQRCMALERKV